MKLTNGHAMLIDFDWAGKVGQVSYPLGLNLEIGWHPEAGPGVPIQKAHDKFMFDRLYDQIPSLYVQ